MVGFKLNLFQSFTKFRYLALSDGVLKNETFRHTAGEQNQESLVGCLHDLKFVEDMDDLKTCFIVSYLRQRLVKGASEWMARKQVHWKIHS